MESLKEPLVVALYRNPGFSRRTYRDPDRNPMEVGAQFAHVESSSQLPECFSLVSSCTRSRRGHADMLYLICLKRCTSVRCLLYIDGALYADTSTTCSHIHMFTYSHTHVSRYSNSDIFTHLHIHMLTYSHAHIHTCTHTHMHTLTHTYIHMTYHNIVY